MRGHELLDKMALVEAKYLAEAEALPLPRQRRRTKWILPAAAACLAAALNFLAAVFGTKAYKGIVVDKLGIRGTVAIKIRHIYRPLLLSFRFFRRQASIFYSISHFFALDKSFYFFVD